MKQLYYIQHEDRFLGIRKNELTFLNLHDGTSLFTMDKNGDEAYLINSENRFVTANPDKESLSLVGNKTTNAKFKIVSSEDDTYKFKTVFDTYIDPSRYELKQSNKESGLELLLVENYSPFTSDHPEKIIWASENESELTPPDATVKKMGFFESAPTRGVFNWLLNNLYSWLDYLHQRSDIQRSNHEVLDNYVRNLVLDVDETLGDAIRQAQKASTKAQESARLASEQAQNAESSKTSATQYAASAESAKNLSVSSAGLAESAKKASKTSASEAATQSSSSQLHANTSKSWASNANVYANNASASASTAATHASNAHRDFTDLRDKIINFTKHRVIKHSKHTTTAPNQRFAIVSGGENICGQIYIRVDSRTWSNGYEYRNYTFVASNNHCHVEEILYYSSTQKGFQVTIVTEGNTLVLKQNHAAEPGYPHDITCKVVAWKMDV